MFKMYQTLLIADHDLLKVLLEEVEIEHTAIKSEEVQNKFKLSSFANHFLTYTHSLFSQLFISFSLETVFLITFSLF